MRYCSAWKGLIVATMALATSACLQEPDAGSEVAVSITNPSASQIDTTDSRITISGTTDSGAAIESVSWKNDLGGSGTASGIESWEATNIPLALGRNTVSVSARTIDGESSTDSLVINRESTGTGSATLSWSAPTQRSDGSPLTNLAGYRIYYGRMSQTYDYEIEVTNPGIVTYVIEGLVPGEWYFAAASVDAAGVESEYSNEVTRTIM
jgi:hypothetical protein